MPISPAKVARRGSRAVPIARMGAPTVTERGVAGDEQPGLRDGDAQAGGHVRQQSHDGELGRADPEGRDG